MSTTKERLLKIHREFHGGESHEDRSELSLFLDILEELIDKAEVQEDHSHTLT